MKYFILFFLCLNSSLLFSQNKAKIDSLTQVLKTNPSDIKKVDLYNKIIYEYRGGDSLQATEYFESAKHLAKEIGYTAGEADACFQMAGVYFIKGNFQDALHFYQESLRLSISDHYIMGQANAFNGLGNGERGLGNFYKAIDYFSKAIDLFTEMGEKRKIAIVYNNIGLIYWDQGDHAAALEIFFKALNIFEELEDRLGIAFCRGNIGHIYEAQKKHKAALKYYFKTLEILKEIKNQGGLLECYNSIAKVYFQQEDYNAALDFYQKALEISKKVEFKEAIGDNLNGLAEVNMALGQYKQALAYLRQSLEMHQEIDLKKGVAETYLIFGKLFIQQKNDLKAVQFLNQALQISQEIGVLEPIRDATELLSQVHQRLGNAEAAYANFRLYIQARDSLKNDAQSQKILQLEFSRERDSLQYVQEKERLFFEEENKRKATTQRATFIGLALALLLILVLAYFFWERQKRNQKLHFTNQKLAESNEEIKMVNEEIQTVNETLKTTLKTVESQRDDILGSINYARRIQTAILPRNDYFKELLPEHFIFFKPRDVVSGDFYWITKTEKRPFVEERITEKGSPEILKALSPEKTILTVADCTGHGVPGAFMSMIGNELLNTIIKEKHISQAAQILTELHKAVRQALQQEESNNNDGMDMALVSIDLERKKLEFAGAKNPLVYIQNNQLYQVKGDIMPIGGEQREMERRFTLHEIDISQPTTFYLFTDGYQDQFGGDHRRKFMIKRLRELLFEIHQKPMEEQKEILEQNIAHWMQEGNEKQIDDMLIIGVRL